MEIKIEIEDERFFSDVAPVVDRETFSEEIERIRRAMGIKNLLNKEQYLEYICKIRDTKKGKQFDQEIEQSRKQLFLPLTFKGVLQKAALRGLIENGDYSPAYLDHAVDDFTKYGGGISETSFIVLSPGARDGDIIKIMKGYRKNKYGYDIPPVWKIDKNKPSLKKYREWYLSNKNGVAPALIAEKETINCSLPEGHNTGKGKSKECTCYDESTIRKGVETYQSLIRKTPTF